MNTNNAVVVPATRGWGISRLLSDQIAPNIGLGRLVLVLECFELLVIPIHAVHQEGRMASPKALWPVWTFSSTACRLSWL
jgi:hypothetical protein